MKLSFWARRFIAVAAALFFIIGAAQLLKGHPIGEAAWHGLVWSVVSATVFTVSRFFQARRGQHCALCNDIPEARDVPTGAFLVIDPVPCLRDAVTRSRAP